MKPSSDSDIKIEVWLPLSGWNGKFLGLGNMGWGGRILYDSFIDGVRRGYAAANTDTGHSSSKQEEAEGRFAVGHPEKLIDYGYRAVHLMTVEGKEFVKAFYGSAPKHSYFIGLSLGGCQALTEAMRFPEDYDGIISGGPANPLALLNAEQLWPSWLIAKDPAKFIPRSKYTMIHEAVLKACDELDGVKDGAIEEPLRCTFDPQVLLCKGADGPDCLTAPQLDLLRQAYAGPVNPRTKELIFPGPALGAELTIYPEATGEVRQTPLALYKYVVFQNPDWDWKTLDYDRDIALALKVTGPVLLADSNLKSFVDHGGKLMMYIGWINYHNPKQLIDYYEDVLKNAGGSKVRNSVRLFTIPGVVQETQFEKIDVMDQWVEKAKAPDQILASFLVDGKVARTRPLCAYPMAAQYKGSGNTNAAENFVCAESKPVGKR